MRSNKDWGCQAVSNSAFVCMTGYMGRIVITGWLYRFVGAADALVGVLKYPLDIVSLCDIIIV